MATNETQKTDSKISVTLNGLYKEYVPKDGKTYNLLLPVFGFSISCFTFGMLMDLVQHERARIPSPMYNYGYLVLAGACAFELYNALEKRNKKQFFPWMVLKSIEFILSLVTLSLAYSSGSYGSNSTTALGVMATLNMIVVLLMLIYVGKRAKATEAIDFQQEQNVYDQFHVKPVLATFNEPIYRNVY